MFSFGTSIQLLPGITDICLDTPFEIHTPSVVKEISEQGRQCEF